MPTPSDPLLTPRRARRLLEDVLRPAVYTDWVELDVGVYQCVEPIAYAQAVRQTFAPVGLGWEWGPVWSTAWFRLRGRVPVDFGKAWRVLFDTGTEALCWWDAVPYQGVELHRQDIRLPEGVEPGDDLELYIEAACNHMLGVEDKYGDAPRMGYLPRTRSGMLRQAHVARYHADRASAVVELELLIDLVESLPWATPRQRQAEDALQDVVGMLREHDLDGTLPAARERIRGVLETPTGGGGNTVYCAGNAHIDLAWLWPIRETKRKASRTFSTVLRYMERHPEYRFMQSQAQLYEWVRQDYPELFEQIQQRAREGRWEVGGGAWVEPDCNLPSGESLVRQFLVGAAYFKEHFGVDQSYFWQPDVFGYSAALPQIMRGAGMDVFFSQKISWSQYNAFPHHSFRWVGIDGSSVVSHFFPADTYIGNNLPRELLHGDTNYKQSGRCPAWLQAYGWGDGGGGPTEAMIERVDRLADCAGLPRAKHSRVDGFAERLRQHLDELPQWVGELYLELHRGTYTSQAFAKRSNRLGERLLQDTEVAMSLRMLGGVSQTGDEAVGLDRLWKLLLLNQFHDLLPGSSIGWAHDDARRDYAAILSGGTSLLNSVFASTSTPASGDAGSGWVVLNTSGQRRSEVVELPEGLKASAVRVGDATVATQEVTGLDGERCRIARLPDLPAMGAVGIEPAASSPGSSATVAVGDLWLENEHLRVELNPLGQVVSMIHKATGRESLARGVVGNRLVLYEDLPADHDAWDLDLGMQDKGVPVESPAQWRVVEEGPVRAAIIFERSVGTASRLTQHVRMTADSPYVEFATEVDWHESHQWLRVLHAVDVHADYATYEIQFGHLRRPNHFNTSWDYARFEVPAQRWMDLSEPGFGVTLLNDCKYGHSCRGNVMGLSLLRSPKSPDPEADMGPHTFRYALMPHAGFDAADLVMAAESINQPPRLLPDASGVIGLSLVEAPADCGAILDTLKPAEDGDGLILRMYECRGARTSCRLRLHSKIVGVHSVDLLERSAAPHEFDRDGDGVTLALRPFQILSLRLRLEPS